MVALRGFHQLNTARDGRRHGRARYSGLRVCLELLRDGVKIHLPQHLLREVWYQHEDGVRDVGLRLREAAFQAARTRQPY
jgi:hypothetical protein